MNSLQNIRLMMLFLLKNVDQLVHPLAITLITLDTGQMQSSQFSSPSLELHPDPPLSDCHTEHIPNLLLQETVTIPSHESIHLKYVILKVNTLSAVVRWPSRTRRRVQSSVSSRNNHAKVQNISCDVLDCPEEQQIFSLVLKSVFLSSAGG